LKKVKVGVIGAGYWGTKLACEYSLLSNQSDDISLDWVADVSNNRLNSIKQQLGRGHIQFCTDYGSILQDEKVDGVHIAVPNHLHYKVARDALESGKHVLIEKPMALSSREAFKLAELSEEKDLVLQVGHIYRFNNALRKLREIVRQEAYGKILYARIVWATHVTPPEGRDIVFDLVPHPIDVLNYLLNKWPIHVNAIGGSYIRKETGQEEVVFINLTFPGTVLANVYASWIEPGTKERSVDLVSEKATIRCDALNQHLAFCTIDGEKTDTILSPNNTIRDMQLHFIERIRGKGPQLNDPLIGATTVQVLEAISRSMKKVSAGNLSLS